MKLAKLSLAAIVAAGAMTTFANAAPLEEAIKGVELKGFMRYRYYNTEVGDDATSQGNRFSAPFSFTMPVAENLKAGLTLRGENGSTGSDMSIKDNGLGGSFSESLNFDMPKMWFLYTQPTYSLKAGMFEIATPWTDPAYGGNRGEGALAMFTGVEGWTFAAAGFTQTNIAIPVLGSRAGGILATNDYTNPPAFIGPMPSGPADIGGEDVYAVAAIGSMGPVNIQLWGATIPSVVDSSIFVDISGKYEGFSLQAQANQLSVASEIETAYGLTDDTGLFWALKAGFGMDGFSVDAGYIANDDDQPLHELNSDSSGMIKFGKNLFYYTSNMTEAETMFANVGYSVGKYSVGAGYGSAEAAGEDYAEEFYVSAGYQYSKNFGLSAFYSDVSVDDAFKNADLGGGALADYNQDDKQEIRFEAKYTF